MDRPGRALSRRQVRDFDRLAIKTWGVPGPVLMENAGRNAADAICKFLGQVRSRRVAVVAGTGNNGGDGFVIARHLQMRGASVAVFLAGSREEMSPDAGTNFAILEKLDFDIRPCGGEAAGLAEDLGGFDVVVDAVGGTGITGPLRGAAAAAVEGINAAARPVVAVDIPTGLDCDSGSAPGSAVRADLTVTFVARKIGFDAPAAADYTGKVVVADIGVPPPRG